MARDWNIFNTSGQTNVNSSNWRGLVAKFNSYYPDGITGYEDYYLDMLTFWR
jgi:hypothetical protein